MDLFCFVHGVQWFCLVWFCPPSTVDLFCPQSTVVLFCECCESECFGLVVSTVQWICLVLFCFVHRVQRICLVLFCFVLSTECRGFVLLCTQSTSGFVLFCPQSVVGLFGFVLFCFGHTEYRRANHFSVCYRIDSQLWSWRNTVIRIWLMEINSPGQATCTLRDWSCPSLICSQINNISSKTPCSQSVNHLNILMSCDA